MSVSNESRIRSWFQFTSKSSANNTANTSITANNNNNTNNGSNAGNGFNGRQTDDESTATKDQSDSGSAQPQTTQTTTTSNTLLERVTSFRRSLGKAQNKKNKIRPNSVKGLTSGAVDQQSIAKSKNSCARKSSSPTSTSLATSGGTTATAGANCDDDEIYGFTSANFDSSNNSTRRQLKSSLQTSNASNAPNASIAPNINVYDSDTNKSGRVRNEERDESHAITTSANSTTTTSFKGLSQDSPEWLKADKEFSFYNQQNQQNFESRESIQSRLYYYKHQYFHDSDINLRHSSTQHLSWVGPITNDTDDIDRIYENMRGLSSALASAQQRHQNHRNANTNNLYANNSSDNNLLNNNNRKLTKDSGYESASASISNWNQQAINANNSNAISNSYFHSRSDSNASSVSTGGSLSPRTAANKNAYQYCDQWSAAKSTSNLPLQVQVSGNRRSSLTGSTHHYQESRPSTGMPVLPAKSVPGNLDRDSDENIVKKRSHNRNNPTPSSVYSLLASKSGFDFAPHLKSSRKSCGASFGDNQFAKYSERFLPKKLDASGSQLWKSREKSLISAFGAENRYETDESPPPTPPVRDSSLSSNRKFNPEVQDMENQSKQMNDSFVKRPNDCGHYYKNNNSRYYMKSYSESRVSHIGCSKSLINLRSKYEDSSDLKQFSQTYPLLPETEFNDKPLTESWSCDQSVTSGVTSLVTTSDYFTASSSVITHSPSLSSLSTNATNTTYNNSRNSISSTGSSSQIAKSSKVVQPKRESASVLYSDKSSSQSSATAFKQEVPPPPPPKLNVGANNDRDISSSLKTSSASSTMKMVSNSRSIETSKSQKSSDPEIKAIQKRAVYQFYLKQKQKEKHENSNNNLNGNASVTPTSPEDNSQVPSRKVQLVVHENIYENSSAHCVSTPPLPSPPLPPPPQTTVADIEYVTPDLPLPPPPTVQEFQCEPSSDETPIDMCGAYYVSKGQQTGRSPSPPKAPSPPTRPRTDGVSQKSEIATQTTDTLQRKSDSSTPYETTEQKEPSLELNETMNQKPNEVPTTQTTALTTNSEQSCDYKSLGSVETVVPWAYSKLWPNEKCVKTSHYDSDNSHISAQNSSPIGLANTFIVDTGVEPNNEDLLANKSELISRLRRKLDILRSEEIALTQDINSNEILGQELRTQLKTLGLTAQESEKINLHCDETEKVTRLLLSISARLQLIETQIKEKSHQKSHQNCLSDECNESDRKHNSSDNSMVFESTQLRVSENDLQEIRDKESAYSSTHFSHQIQSLVSKREKLLSQLEEALQLRVSIDHRNQLIEDKIVRKYFTNKDQNLNQFLEFIKLKSKLIVDIREVRDQIVLAEKQMFALQTNP